MRMKQEEIVNEIKKKCGNVEHLPSVGWHFYYNRRHYVYMDRKNDAMLRICVTNKVKRQICERGIISKYE